jgi:hypothetical protein
MFGRPLRLVTTTVAAALAMVLTASAAYACCGCGGCASAYVAPPVVYRTPCVSCQTYIAPRFVYAPPCVTCGIQPALRVDLGPTYTLPVASEEEPVAEYAYPGAYPYVGRYDRYGAWRGGAWRGGYRSFVGRRANLLGGPRLGYGPGMRGVHAMRGPVGRPGMLHRRY